MSAEEAEEDAAIARRIFATHAQRRE
jgi:hypothetical protein